MWLALSLTLAACWLLYYLWTNNYNYWKARNFPFIVPSFPFGNMRDTVLCLRYNGYVLQELYDKATLHPYVGIFILRRPQLLIKDPAIIKHVLVKDFNHFRDRIVAPSTTPLSDHLFALSGERWRAMRIKLTPTFTSGKLKTMYTHFQSCAFQLDGILEEKATGQSTINIKDMMMRFTYDIIATCAFGLELNLMKDQNNEFIKISKLIFPPKRSLSSKIKTALNSTFPQLESLFKFRFLPEWVTEFILSVIKETVEYREKNHIKRNDFLDLLIELKNKSNIEFLDGEHEEYDKSKGPNQQIDMTLNLMAAQCFVFILAGFETSSSVQSYCMYELALNPDMQEKLRDEIDEVTEKHGGLTYQAIQEMEYLDQVVSETMRKYPTLPFLNRTCSTKYQMPDTGLVVEEGTRLIIPVYCLHHDPKNFPDPEKFDPDRFSPERKSSIQPYTYLPFGEGPRLCIGMRFGLLQTKTGLCTMFKKYKLSPSEETMIPLKFVSTSLITSTEGPIMLKIEPRPPKKTY